MNDDGYEDEGRQVVEWKEEGGSLAETGSTALAFMGKLFDFAKEREITKREIERYRTMRDIAITEITKRYERDIVLIKETFAERRLVIEKHFEAIDKGLETHNYELVNKGLDCITSIVKDNPFRLFQVTTASQRRDMLKNGDLAIEY